MRRKSKRIKTTSEVERECRWRMSKREAIGMIDAVVVDVE